MTGIICLIRVCVWVAEDPGFVDTGNVCVAQGSSVDYKLPLMQSPPPLRRASLPFFAAYNPPTHTLSVLLDTPEHSEHQSLSLHADTGWVPVSALALPFHTTSGWHSLICG